MSKITLSNVGSLIDATTAQTTINSDFSIIQTAFDNTLSRDGTSPNTMSASIDMNSQRVLNLPKAATANEPLRLQELNDFVGGGTVTNIPAGGNSGDRLVKNSSNNYDVSWSTESSDLTAGSNIVITGSSPATIATSLNPTFSTVTTPRVNKVSITQPNTIATLTLADNKTVVVNNSLTLAGTDTAIITFQGTDTYVGRTTADTLTNKTLTSPTMTAPTLGIIASGDGSALTGTAASFTAGHVTTNANLTGDVTSVGNIVTLASVASAGTTGSSTAIPVVTINAKGLTTSITTAAVIAPGNTLSGTVVGSGTSTSLASSILASSLTSLGTIGTLTATNINAFTLAGTISGGGQQLNNIVIGTTTPLAGSFTSIANTSQVLTGGSLANAAQVLSITATQPTSPVATQNAIAITIAGAGSASQANNGLNFIYSAGYTGSSSTRAALFANANAGTGNTLIAAAGTGPSTGNFSQQSNTSGSTTGLNIGTEGVASAGAVNVGIVGIAQIANNSATNIGGAFSAINTGTSPVHIGVFASLNQTALPTVSAALLADNGSQSDPVARFRVNAVDNWTISGTGNLTASIAARTLVLKQGANGTCGTFVANGVTPVTISNTNVAVTDAIIISLNTVGGTVGVQPHVATITAATGFTVVCTATDTSTYNYAIIKNAA